MKRSYLITLVVLTFVLFLCKFLYIHDYAVYHHDNHHLKHPVFNIYGSDRVQLQLLAVHGIWYDHSHDHKDASDTNSFLRSTTTAATATSSDNQQREHLDSRLIWRSLLHSDVTLKILHQKCIANSQNILAKSYAKSNHMIYGELDWLSTTSGNKKCPELHTNGSIFVQVKTASLEVLFTLLGECNDDRSSISYRDVTLYSIYKYYDQVVEMIYYLRKKFPNTIVVWSKPHDISSMSSELTSLHNYLIMKHLIHDNGVLVLYSETLEKSQQNKAYIFQLLRRKVECLMSYQTNEVSGLTILSPSTSSMQDSALKSLVSNLAQRFRYDKVSYYNATKSQLLHNHCSTILNSRKYDEMCLPYPETLLPILVTGAGGSGTHYIANTLRQMGLHFKHESIDTDGSVSWLYAFNDVYMRTQYPYHAKIAHSTLFSPRFRRVVHVTRCPIDQIASITTFLSESYQFLNRTSMVLLDNVSNKYTASTMASMQYDSKCGRGSRCNLPFAASSWLFVNQHVSTYADEFYHIENSTYLFHYICAYLSTISGETRCTNGYVSDSLSNGQSASNFVEKYLVPTQYRHYVHGSKYHKLHEKYNISDIKSIDNQLFNGVVQLSAQYKYSDTCSKCL